MNTELQRDLLNLIDYYLVDFDLTESIALAANKFSLSFSDCYHLYTSN